MFAKIYGPEDDQVLVVRTTDADNAPQVNITTEAVMYPGAETKGLVTIILPCVNENASMWLFDHVDETRARAELAPWLEQQRQDVAAAAAKLGN